MTHTNSRTLHILDNPMNDERGQTIAEYAILLAFIAVTVALVLPLLGTSISGFFDPVVNTLGG
jgi:Flp pilus assembly pilin Flp